MLKMIRLLILYWLLLQYLVSCQMVFKMTEDGTFSKVTSRMVQAANGDTYDLTDSLSKYRCTSLDGPNCSIYETAIYI